MLDLRTGSGLMLLAVFAVGCDTDRDEDGLLASEEKELGTDPKQADTDGDGLNDGEEVALGSDPLATDTDADGVDDNVEVELGLDPNATDTDGDGVSDGDEIAADSDPANPWSWPDDIDGWPDFSEGAPAGTGYGIGDTIPDFGGTDQFGNSVSVSQFNGGVILLDFSAGWCGPCRTVAGTAEELYQDFAEEGFMIVHAMVDDYTRDGVINDPEFLNGWAAEYDLSFPVIDATDRQALNGLAQSGLYRGGIPFMVLLDQDRTIVSAYTGSQSEAQIISDIEGLLGSE